MDDFPSPAFSPSIPPPPLADVPIRINAPITQKRPVAAGVFDFCEIDRDHEYLGEFVSCAGQLMGKQLAKRGYNVIIGGEAQGMAPEITLKPGNGIVSSLLCESKLMDANHSPAVSAILRKGTTQPGDLLIIDGTKVGMSLATFMEGLNRFIGSSIKNRKLAGKPFSSGKVLFLFDETPEMLITY